MLDPQSERWAVATLKGVGPYRQREMDLDGRHLSYDTFDIDLDVLDGWNVPTGALRTFWWEGSASRRFVLERMVGQRVLVRFAPVKDGHHLLVGTSVDPAFEARPGEPFVSIVLPYGPTRLEVGDPLTRGWKSLWRAGLALDANAYPDFAMYMQGARMPLTEWLPRDAKYDRLGKFLSDERPGREDAAWLFRISKEGRPEFQMLAAEYLRHRSVEGALKTKRELVLRALREPDAFPNGFLRVINFEDLFTGDATAWLPIPQVVEAMIATKSPALVGDLVEILVYERYFVADRAKLLPLLASRDVEFRAPIERAFASWHGKPPKDVDPVAWHRERAKLGQEALAAVRANGSD